MDKKVEFFHFQLKLETIVCVKIWFWFQNFDCLSFRRSMKNIFSKARIGDGSCLLRGVGYSACPVWLSICPVVAAVLPVSPASHIIWRNDEPIGAGLGNTAVNTPNRPTSLRLANTGQFSVDRAGQVPLIVFNLCVGRVFGLQLKLPKFYSIVSIVPTKDFV